ncbi:MAG TPA: thioredoxin domain-containing protein [Anaerolineales bacterium]|nr:thioredoxin domain-containing protein [Anaerolineales bacterium]
MHSPEPAAGDPGPLSGPDDDPINTSGDFFFKRFDAAAQPAGTGDIDDEALDEVVETLSRAEPPVDTPARPALTITFNSWATPVVGLVMLVLGMAGGYFLRPLITAETGSGDPASNSTASSGTQTQSSPEDRAALMSAIVPNVRHFLGDPDAPITLVEFSDFQCPFCGRYAADAGRQIQEAYVSTGEVRIGFVHFAFLGPESQWAAEASECAADQDMFWEYHDLLFANQSGENGGEFNRETLKAFAVDLGLETEAFNTCIDTQKYAQTVLSETQWAQSVGVQSTPTFVVNGFPVIGAQPISVFEEVFNTVLNP